jgi:hypothetical protein
MTELIGCACGHGISAHSSLGCGNDHPRTCPCRITSSDLLELAVQSARVRYDSTQKVIAIDAHADRT